MCPDMFNWQGFYERIICGVCYSVLSNNVNMVRIYCFNFKQRNVTRDPLKKWQEERNQLWFIGLKQPAHKAREGALGPATPARPEGGPTWMPEPSATRILQTQLRLLP